MGDVIDGFLTCRPKANCRGIEKVIGVGIILRLFGLGMIYQRWPCGEPVAGFTSQLASP